MPYATFQDLSNSIGVVPSVRFNGDPVYVLKKTTQPSGKGDAPGVAKGVKSNTVTGEVKPTNASSTVHVGGRRTVRDGDSCTMNGGNNPGIYCTTQAPSASPPASAAKTSSPRVKVETPAEKGMFEKAYDEVKEARQKVIDEIKSVAQDYKDKVSGDLHKAASDAAYVGDTLVVGGAVTTGVGAVGVATGIGVIPGAGAVTAGAGITAVGTEVDVVATSVESAATGLDVASEIITTGTLPDLETVAKAYFERLMRRRMDRLLTLVPGQKAKGGVPRASTKDPKGTPKVDSKSSKTEGKVDTKKADKVDTRKAEKEPPEATATTARQNRLDMVPTNRACSSTKSVCLWK